jgi:hypothetical protein
MCLALAACSGGETPLVGTGADGVRAVRADVRGVT